MSLLFFDGFDNPATGMKSEWSGTTANNQTGRNGETNGALGINSGTTGRTLTLASTASTLIFGVAVKPNVSGVFGYTTAPIMGIAGASGALRLTFQITASGHAECRLTSASGTVVATATTNPLSLGAWHYVEMMVVLHASAGSIQVKVDGVTVINVAGVQTSTVSENATGIRLYSGGSTNSNTHFDDLYVCDAVNAVATQGLANNAFLGDLRVYTLIPTGAGDSTQWTPSTGANYAAVDESPANTTDYVSAATTGLRDLYQMSDLGGTVNGVFALQANVYAQKSDAGAASVSPVLKEAEGTVAVQTAIPLTTSWLRADGPMVTTKPSSPGTIFSPSDVNGLQVGLDSA